MEKLLQANNLEKSYGSLQVLKGVNMAVNKGEILSITGASGAGKSTLLHILGTLDAADAGQVTIGGVDILKQSDTQKAAFRNQSIGFIFQFHNLLPEFTALENVCMPALIQGKEKTITEQKALELLNVLGLEGRADHKPAELSGGEQQRVAVARALINDPMIVFADEPSGNLDSKNATDLHNLFFSLRDKLGQTFVIVTHNEELAQMADRRIEMKDGKTIT